ncbi:YdeI/OmpD-associated family protein [Aerolutibacter daejeonensis]|uniref:YdeI/OmpD-associated family protein n=1 Tax=Aerolutibacter daejeonensis TaxID=346181 RepID=UPI000563E250|nr:YdeI/OmpD-associated family protein [Lysobacter daejeonensis]
MSAGLPTDLPIALFTDAAEWEAWLDVHGDSKGVWLKIAKKGADVGSVTYAEALDAALCHGWIDGQKRGCDARYFLQRFTPRRARSLWSRINIGHVERLTAAGRMRPSGLREVEAAKADGRWDQAYEGGRDMPVPEELAKALAKNAKARRFFEQLDRTNRYAFCWRVHTAKKAETRQSRAASFVEMMAKGEKLHA